MKELDEIPIHLDFLNQKVEIGTQLWFYLHDSFIKFLKQHRECFTWSHINMIGIDPKVSVHQLQTTN